MKKSNRKAPVVFYIGLAIFFLVLVSTNLTSGLYAKYATKSISSDSGRIAKFNVSDGFLSGVYSIVISDMNPGESFEQSFSVNNDSEVAVNFKVTSQNLTGNLPIVVEVVDVNFAPETSGTVNFRITWPITSVGGTSTDSSEYAGKIDVIKLFVSITQID